MLKRAYSLLTIKAIDEDQRIITGIATTPTPDRVGDIVEPKGAEFNLPIPLLWQHDSSQPIGHVTNAKVTAAGIEVVAQLVKIADPGPLKDRLDEAWQSIKSGLVRGFSIGFKELEWTRIEDTYSYRFVKWLWLELSAVTIPANGEATIQTVKSIDTAQRAASGRKPQGVVQLTAPVASGQSKSVSLTPQEGKNMKTIAEQIAALEAKRGANFAKQVEVMQKSIDAGRSTDDAEQEQFDTLQQEIEAIDKDLERLRKLEKTSATSARAVHKAAGEDATAASAARSGAIQVRSVEDRLPPGVRFARLAKMKALAKIDSRDVVKIAEERYGADSEVVALLKTGEVVAGSNVSGNWAANLHGTETSAYADFANFLRPLTIVGKFGAGGLPALRSVPFDEPLLAQTAGGAAGWVGENKPIGMTSFDFSRTTLTRLKVGSIAAVTIENVRSSSPSSELIIRDALAEVLTATIDTDFITPTNAGSAGVKPAAVNYGAPTVAAQSGGDAADIRLDIRALYKKFSDTDNPLDAGVLVMSMDNAMALATMVNALGQSEFPGMTKTGGTLLGMSVIASRYAGSYVTLANASDVYLADEGDVQVDMTTEASLEFKNAANLTQNPAAGTGASLISTFQNNLAAFRALRTINWKARRTVSTAYLTGVAWGGAVPAS